MLLGSMDDSDDDLDLDFGPDIGKLVADLVGARLTCSCQQCQDSLAADTAFRRMNCFALEYPSVALKYL